MPEEYLQKIIAVGNNGKCTSDDVSYFELRRPDIANLMFLLQSDQAELFRFFSQDLGFEISDEESLTLLMADFIKGCHIVEKASGGYGSTSVTKQLINKLRSKTLAVEIYNWIAANGGNYFIDEGVTYEENAKKEELAAEYRLRILENDQKIHREAAARKLRRNKAHQLKSDSSQNLYRELTESFQQMSENQLIDNINATVDNPMTGDSQDVYRAALLAELKRRGFDYTAMGTKKYLPLDSRVKLDGIRIMKIE